MIDTFDYLRTRFARQIPERTSATVRTYLASRRSTAIRQARAGAGSLARSGTTLRKVRRAARHWGTHSIHLATLPQVLRRSFGTSRKAMTRARTGGRASDFHDWRKRVKHLWYQLRLVERLASGLSTHIEEFGELEAALGEEHNLAVLRTKLSRDRVLRRVQSQSDRLTAMSTTLQEELRRSALVLGTRLYGMSPKEFEDDLRRRLQPKGAHRRRRPSSAPHARRNN